VATTVDSENAYLQVGNETGLVSMIFFVGLVVLGNRRLRKRCNEVHDLLTLSWRGALLGISLGALLLPAWTEFPVGMTAWLGVGLCLNQLADPGHTPSEQYTSSPASLL
jgi:O-antigen ligase